MTTTATTENQLFPDNLRVINGSAGAIWHKSAPRAVRRAYSSGDHADGWTAWKQHLAGRKKPSDLTDLLPSRSRPLDWALPGGTAALPGPAWLVRAEQVRNDGRPAGASVEQDLLGWLGESAGSAVQTGYALEALACGHAMVRLAAVLSPEVWWALLDHLLAAVSDADAIEPDQDPSQRSPLVRQWLAGELALTLAYLFPEIVPCRKLKSPARRALSAGLVDLLDGEGLPHAVHLPLLRPLLACWTRCRALGDELQGGYWTAAAEEQYEWLVRQALRLMRHDGTQALSDGSADDSLDELFRAALRFGGDDDDRIIAASVLPGKKKPGKRSIGGLTWCEPATHSEWAAVAVLRRAWSRSAERLTLTYAGESVRTELACGKDVLLSGRWELDVCLDGEPAVPVSDWEHLCWISDEDVDYLELQMELTGKVRVQRQMLLAREDRFGLLADVVLGPGSGKLEYRGRLPLCPGVSFQQTDQTREGFLVGSKRRASVLPLALPEWRCDRPPSGTERGGELSQIDGGLELRQSTSGRRLYAPLFFDFDRRRMTRPLTWRQLTVAESLEIQPADAAAGFRVAAGKQQWLIYRSLAEKANRTLLGHNLSTEMLVARFDRSGEVEPLLEIE